MKDLEIQSDAPPISTSSHLVMTLSTGMSSSLMVGTKGSGFHSRQSVSISCEMDE